MEEAVTAGSADRARAGTGAPKDPTSPFRDVEAFFTPSSVVMVGASSRSQSIGGAILGTLRKYGFPGEVLAVNPKYDRIGDIPCFPSVEALPHAIDLAIVAVRSPNVPEAVRACAAKGVAAVVVFSAGFAEIGEDGKRLQEELAQIAKGTGIRILGPNCLGAINGEIGLTATFAVSTQRDIPRGGCIDVVSQSGAFGAYALDWARERGLPVRRWITTGNEVDVDFADCMAASAASPDCSLVLGYLEGCRDGRKLAAALQLSRETSTAVVVVKVGNSPSGEAVARSHTAATVGSHDVYRGVFEQFGVHCAGSIEEAYDVAYARAVGGPVQGSKLAVISMSGGLASLTADTATNAGMDLTPLPLAAQRRLSERIPFAAVTNPIDVTGQVANDLELFPWAAGVVADEGDFDAIVSFQQDWPAFTPYMIETWRSVRRRHPELFIAVVCPVVTQELRARFSEIRATVFEDPVRAVMALAGARRRGGGPGSHRSGDAIAMAAPVPDGPHSELDAIRILSSAGIAFPEIQVAMSREQAAAAAESLGYPVVAKLISPDVPHKTAVDGVEINLWGRQAVMDAYERIVSRVRKMRPDARIDGVLIARQVPPGLDLLIGTRIDPVFGPVVALDLGGPLVGIACRPAVRLAPIEPRGARALVDSFFAALSKNSTGDSRHRSDDTCCDLSRVVATVSRLAAGASESLSVIEMNPYRILPSGEGIALDALIDSHGGNFHGGCGSSARKGQAKIDGNPQW